MPTTNPLLGAVVPAAPAVYDQAHMTVLVDVLNKLLEQVVRPQQITAASMVLTALPHDTPRLDIEGEVYTKECAACGATVLAIEQTLPEVLVGRRAR